METNDEYELLDNDLILLQIFSYLPIKHLNTAIRVCKNWKRLKDLNLDLKSKNAYLFFLM